MHTAALTAAARLLAQIAGTRERRLLWLAGSGDWTLAAAQAIAAALNVPDTLWLGTRGSSADPNRRTSGLGREYGLLVVDAWAGLDLDALGAAVGTLRGGGLLVLLTPPAADWPEHTDPATARFATFPHQPEDVAGRLLRRLCRLLHGSPAVQRIDAPADAEDRALPAADSTQLRLPPVSPPLPNPSDLVAATPDQARAVAAILDALTGPACRPLVLTADRGRGKSAAMGLAAAQLQIGQNSRILLTAPRRSAAAAVLRHAGTAAPRYLSPDALLAETPPADLLLVDEAAGIPAPLLECMLQHYPSSVFATTVHGYEGTGRGFDVRFRGVLDRRTPGWRALRLSAPIRWATDDPLEALVNRALLLDAEPAGDAEVAALLGTGGHQIHSETPDRDHLADNEPLLRQVFGLLVLGHYQTRPSDLRQLLDAPDIAVHLLRAGETVLATAVTGREGRLPAALLEPIFAGRRRPQGHLLPQTLSAHAGLYAAPALDCRRMLRIAVHPVARRRGLGQRLVAAIAAEAAADGADLLGTSFGATPELLRFWRRCGLVPVHIGSRRNAASGAHAAVLLHALTPAGEAVVQLGRKRLMPRLGVLLAGPLRDLPPAVVAGLLAGAPGATEPLADTERRELHAFAGAARGLDATRPALHRLLCTALPQALAAGTLPQAEADAVIACGLQHHTPAEAALHLGATGKAAVTRLLRQAVSQLLSRGTPEAPTR